MARAYAGSAGPSQSIGGAAANRVDIRVGQCRSTLMQALLRQHRARQRPLCQCAYGCGDETEGLEREDRELRQANEILRKASAYIAQAELDRRFKP